MRLPEETLKQPAAADLRASHGIHPRLQVCEQSLFLLGENGNVTVEDGMRDLRCEPPRQHHPNRL